MRPEFDQHMHQSQFVQSALMSRMSLTARRKAFGIFTDLIRPAETDHVLDVGVSPEGDDVAINFFERMYPWPHRITATSISDCSFLEKQCAGLRFVQTDGARLPFNDQEFDIVFSNAVIEHVGSREQQRAFASEVCRVGKRVFVTTPNRWYPLDFHTRLPFTHWLPRSVYRPLWRSLGLHDWATEENLNLLERRSLRDVFAGQRVRIRHMRFLGMPSNLIAWRP